MEFCDTLSEGIRAVEQTGGQEVGLSVKSAALEPRVLAFAHDLLHVFADPFQVTQDDALKLADDLFFGVGVRMAPDTLDSVLGNNRLPGGEIWTLPILKRLCL